MPFAPIRHGCIVDYCKRLLDASSIATLYAMDNMETIEWIGGVLCLVPIIGPSLLCIHTFFTSRCLEPWLAWENSAKRLVYLWMP